MEEKEEYLHFMSGSGEWDTPQDLFDDLNELFAFDLDAAANKGSTKCEHWLGEGSDLAEDALSVDWKGTVFLNPPYGRQVGKWVRKARESARDGTVIVCLLPARTDTKWFQNVWDAQYVVFIFGRLKFGEATTPAPFPSVLAIFGDPQDLPPDRELTFLAEYGTVVRPVWKYAPVERARYDKRVSVPFIGTVLEYRRARDPNYLGAIPEERAFAKAIRVERWEDVCKILQDKDNAEGGSELMDEGDGEPGGEA
jgi:phage N-6-adenine-methyltransferase